MRILKVLLRIEKFNQRGWPYLFIFLQLAIGFLVLAGWFYSVDTLKRFFPFLVAMNPTTASLFILLGIAYLLIVAETENKIRRMAGKVIACLIIITAILKLTAWGSPGFKIDHIILEKAIRRDAPDQLINSMAISTALGFIFSGISLLLLHEKPGKRSMLSHVLAFMVLQTGFFTLLGYVYRAPEYYNLLVSMPMAMHTALCFILFSLAVIFRYPQAGIAGVITAKFSGSFMARLLVPVTVIIPVVLGTLVLYAAEITMFSTQFGIMLMVFMLTISMSIIIWFNADKLNKKEILLNKSLERFRSLYTDLKETAEKLMKSEESFQTLVNSVRDYAIMRLDKEGKVVTWNKGAERIKGYTAPEIKGKHIAVFYTKEDLEKGTPYQNLELATKFGRIEQEGWRVRKNGSIFWADIVITAVYDKNGDLMGFSKVTRDSSDRKKAADVMANFKEKLEKQVKEKTRRLEETNQQLRQLAAHLQTAREEERKKIAREIHDELGQLFTGLKMDIVWLRKNAASHETVITLRFDKTLELLNNARMAMRRISTDLHPAVLHDLGLSAALELHCRELSNRSGLKIAYVPDVPDIKELDIPSDISIGLFRVVQESLTNVIKHAGAHEVNVFLKIKNGMLVLGISDDGIGFNVKETAGKVTLGLVSMRERALMMGGVYKIHSIPGEGTTVLLKVPLISK